MKCLSARLWIIPILLLAAGGQARADYLNWSYSSDPSVPGVTAGATSSAGGATVSLTDYTNHAGGASIPVIAYLTSSSLSTPITFSPSGSPPTTYNMTLTLTDNATHDSKTLNFAGSIAGTLSATASTLVNTLSPASESVTFDGHKYTVSIPSVSLAAPTSPQQNIMANVVVSNVNSGGAGGNTGNGGGTGSQPGSGSGSPPGGPGGSGGISGVPEPTTLVLGGLGFTLMGLGCWRKPRRRQ